MSDAETPKRGRGRPRVNPIEGVRRNVTLQVGSDLYDLIKGRAGDSGRSLSREMEFGLEQFFTGTTEAVAQQALASAIEAARDEEYAEIEKEFGGRLPMTFLSFFADAFNAELRKATAGDSDNAALFKDERRLADFGQALSGHIPGALNAIRGLLTLGNLLDQFTKLEKTDPAEFEKLRAQINQMAEARAASKAKKSAG